MLFNLFRHKDTEKNTHVAESEGFASLVGGVRFYAPGKGRSAKRF